MKPNTCDPPTGLSAARPASRNWNLIKTATQIVGVWGFALVLLPALAVKVDRKLGFPGFAEGSDGPPASPLWWPGARWASPRPGTWSTAGRARPSRSTPPAKLVVEGPYRYIRNPMVVSAIAQSSGIAPRSARPAGLIPIAGIIVWNRYLRPPEEQFLADLFGDPYVHYTAAVKCWVPRLRPYRPGRRAGRRGRRSRGRLRGGSAPRPGRR